jgi:transcriptional regulator with GAF, ATPase, and Fis domain
MPATHFVLVRVLVIGAGDPGTSTSTAALSTSTREYVENLCLRYQRRAVQLADDARQALLSYRWPGNVRELVNTFERAVVLARGEASASSDDCKEGPHDALTEFSTEQHRQHDPDRQGQQPEGALVRLLRFGLERSHQTGDSLLHE